MKKLKIKEYILFLIIIIWRIFYYMQNKPISYYNDSSGYMDHSLKEVLTNIWPRTPVYPLLNALGNFILGEYGSYFVVGIQISLSMIAVVFFYKLLCILDISTILVYIGTFLYGISSAVAGYDQCILTESLSISCMTIFLFYIIQYIRTTALRSGIIATALVFIMTFLRPASLVYMFLTIIFFILHFLLTKTHNGSILLVLNLCAACCILLYCARFETKYGLFSISDPMPRNLLFLSMEQGFYVNSDNEEFIRRCEKSLQENNGMTWKTMTDVRDQYQPKELQKLAANSIINSLPNLYSSYLHHLFLTYGRSAYYGYNQCRGAGGGIYDFFKKIQPFYGFHAFVASILELMIAIGLWIREKKIPWIHIGLSSFMISTLCLNLMTGPGEFIRLTILLVPFLHVLIILYLDRTIRWIKKFRLKNKY